MEHGNLKEKEVEIDIEIGEPSHGTHAKRDPVSCSKWREISLKKLVGGILGFGGSGNGEPTVKPNGISSGSLEYPDGTMKLLDDKNSGGQQSRSVGKDHEKERQKGGKVKKAPKPPRPPKGPSLDAADMRLLKEISKISIKKRERMGRVKAFKGMKAMKSSPASSLSSSSSLSSCGAIISAMFVTVLFFLVLIFQGLDSRSSSNLTLAGAPQPAPETS